MKKIVIVCLTLSSTLLLNAQDDYTVKGIVGNEKKNGMAWLAYKNENGRQADSAKIVNGRFEFRGKTSEPFYATVVLDVEGRSMEVLSKTRKLDLLKFYVEKGTITITCADSITYGKVSGSPVTNDKLKLNALLKNTDEQLRKVANDKMFQPPCAELDNKYNQLEQERQAILKRFITENPSSYISLAALEDYAGIIPNPDVIEPLFESLSANVKQTVAAKNFLALLHNTRTLKTGTIAPDFEQADTTGQKFRLSSLRGKYVLVDFWASWCKPCRLENPDLVKAYEKYKAKGFTILSVSLDQPDGKKEWLKAIATDKMNWQHVSDLKGWSSEVVRLYAIRAIPKNFLIGPDGKIIATELYGQKIGETLKKILVP